MPGAVAAAVRTETRQIQRMQIRAAFEPATFDADKRTVEIVWTTGAKGLRRGWDVDYYEELAVTPEAVRLERLNSGAPLMDSHDYYGGLGAVIGVVERAWLDGGKGRAVVRFSERADVGPIMKDVQTGILRNISVGYDVYKYERIRSVGSDGKPDGGIDTYRAIDWEPMELSFVSMPFDTGAQVRSREGSQPHNPTHDVMILTRGESATTEVPEMTEEEMRAAAAAAELKRIADAAESKRAADAAAEAAKLAERERMKAVLSTVRKAGGALTPVQLTDLETRCSNENPTVDQAREWVIDAMAARQAEQGASRAQSGLEVGVTDVEKWRTGAFNWLVRKAAVGYLFKDSASMDPGEFRGLSLVDLARESLVRSGVAVRGIDKMSLVGMALTYRSAYNGTSDFAVLLENTMHKTLLGAFATAPDTWRKWCAVGSVSDFRAHNRYRLGSFGTLDTVNEHGEFKNKSIPDGEKQSISAKTKGNIIALSRQAIINDDMGAFNGLATSFGRMAGLSLESDAYSILGTASGLGPNLSDGNPVFYARAPQGTNIGTGAALSITSIDLDRQVMASQKDISGNEYLDIRPAVLLVPLSLGGQARIYNNAQYDTDVSNKFQVPNKVVGLYREVVDTPRLTGTRRYQFADPNVAPVYEMVFLDGQQQPFMDNQNGWRVDGVEWKVRLDAGIGAVGYQGATTNAGA